MCGITGFVNFSGHDPVAARERARRMAATLRHRGPDAEGSFADDWAAFGHRRLSIIDLAAGAQPMATEDRRLWIVFNGEIYNFLELRRELEAHGARFRTRCDTEVILLGYLHWGEAVAERLNGMFAYAIWDTAQRRLSLARDRVGKKPLYYRWHDGVFSFASELKALLAGGFVPREIDPEALDCYLSFGYVPSPRTIFAGARKLPAASCLSVTEAGPRRRRYWSLSFAAPRERPPAEAAEELEELLDDAVRCRLMSEVPLGAFLSGGLDSPLVVSSMARVLERPPLTHTIGFADPRLDELGPARAVAASLGTDHREFTVEIDAAEAIPRIAWHFDEPLADASAVPTWHVCQMARERVTVALSGDGGDEGFGGYTFRYLPHRMESRLRKWLPSWLRGPLFGGLGAVWPASARLPGFLRWRTILENLAVGDAEAFCRDLAWLRPERRRRLYRPEYLEALRGFTPFETVMPLYRESDAADPLGRSQATDIRFYMSEDVLVKVDRLSMAHSLEVRCPLLDHRVLEFAATLPAASRMRGRRGKLPLRRLARKRLPQEVLAQPKRGFSPPTAEWLRRELCGPMDHLVRSGESLVHDYLDTGELVKLWREHRSKARDHSVVLWAILMLQQWESLFWRGDDLDPRPASGGEPTAGPPVAEAAG